MIECLPAPGTGSSRPDPLRTPIRNINAAFRPARLPRAHSPRSSPSLRWLPHCRAAVARNYLGLGASLANH
jgi:hypothetical protein